MALTISNNVPLITPVYAPIVFTVADPNADYLELDVYIGDSSKGQYAGTKRTLRFTGNSWTADIQGIVQPFFSSDASIASQLKRIDVLGRSWLNNVSTNLYEDNFYVFNGVLKDTWDPSAYIGKQFLNNYNADIDIHWIDKDSKLYLFSGIFSNSVITYDASNVNFRTTVDGIPSAGFSITGTVPTIRELKIDPSSLTAAPFGLTFTSETLQYTIDPSINNSIGIKTVNITPQVPGFTPKRIAWIDRNGCIDYFNFDLLTTNSLEINRTSYKNSGTLRQYNNSANDLYTVTSNWITEAQSLALKDLWTSPSVMVNGKYVIIQNKAVNILTRNNTRLINYVCEYMNALEYKIQLN